MIASRLGVPVVPVRLDGLDRVLPPHARFPTVGRGRVRVRRSYLADGNDYAALADAGRSAVQAL